MSSNNYFTCVSCTEEYDRASTKAYDVLQSTICYECATTGLVPRFESALLHEFNYPVTIGNGLIISANTLADLLGQEFVAAYKRKEIEYSTPPIQRLYCQNLIRASDSPGEGKEASRPIALSAAEVDAARGDGIPLVECGAMFADQTSISGSELSNARCYHCGDVGKPPRSREDSTEDRFQGLIRGNDYQICPNPDCKLAIERSAFCNHMICHRCGTSYCNVCGKAVAGNSGHWLRECPRNGQPGTDEAEYDIDPRALEADLLPVGNLGAPIDGQTWFDISPQVRADAMDYVNSLQRELGNLNVGGLHEEAVQLVHGAFTTQFFIREFAGSMYRLQDEFNAWVQNDVRIRLLASHEDYHGLLDWMPILNWAIAFHLEHRESFAAQVKTRIAQLDVWTRPRAFPGRLDALPRDLFAGGHAESCLRALHFMIEARFQWLNDPLVQSLALENFDGYTELDNLINYALITTFHGSARLSDTLLANQLGFFRLKNARIEHLLGRLDFSHGRFPLFVEAVEFWRALRDVFERQALARLPADCYIPATLMEIDIQRVL
ncbi:IBR domain, a half RING-finger domain [Teratosphaeria destructans]|uniref:IBR domain, a half RING-finger domain n=1 Tax=Teratosphaeria destructans TaxID=418781 RepID=A0A9W7W098_9PEZI|nr:IBR domain, a half RING-finger domain [Teratosphaeria destructans]